MRESQVGPDRFFFDHRGGRSADDSEFASLARGYELVGEDYRSGTRTLRQRW
jgi:hypothetical protein